jgi:hypothetical protein
MFSDFQQQIYFYARPLNHRNTLELLANSDFSRGRISASSGHWREAKIAQMIARRANQPLSSPDHFPSHGSPGSTKSRVNA